MLKTEEREIGDHVYRVTQLDAMRARRVFHRMAQIVAPLLKEIAAGKTDGAAELTDEQANAKFLAALADLATKTTPEDLDFFCEQFASSTCVVMYDDNGKERSPKLADIMRLHFIGDRFADQFKWLAFCFEVNFSSFFGVLGQKRDTSSAAQKTGSR